MRRAITIPLSVVLSLQTMVLAQYFQPEAVPVARLLPNLESRVRQRPEDPRAHYLLGRIHGLAAALRSNVVWVEGWRKELGPCPACLSFHQEITAELKGDSSPDRRFSDDETRTAAHAEVSRKDALDHALQSVMHLRKAVDLDPDAALYQLGLAYAFETSASFAADISHAQVFGPWQHDVDPAEVETLRDQLLSGSVSVRTLTELQRELPVLDRLRTDVDATVRERAIRRLADLWLEHAWHCYTKAFLQSRATDGALDSFATEVPGGYGSLISYEAAQAIERLTPRVASVARADLLDAAREQIQKLKDLPAPSWITPIVFSLRGNLPLDELLGDHAVAFDLDGDGRTEAWPWVRGDAAVLVWDPRQRGRITSGRELFGSATWWMFFADGYAALDALDDDGDGWLRGAELRGLAIWRDANEDGHSDPGEVIAIEHSAVKAFATRVTGHRGRSLVSEGGLLLDDGRVLATYDWVTAPVPVDREASGRP